MDLKAVKKMLLSARLVLAVICIGFSTYILITGNDSVLPYMLFFLGAMMLVTGAAELKANRKPMAIFSFIAAAFVLFVFIYTI